MAKIENKRTLSKKLDLAGILNMEEADNVIANDTTEDNVVENSDTDNVQENIEDSAEDSSEDNVESTDIAE